MKMGLYRNPLLFLGFIVAAFLGLLAAGRDTTARHTPEQKMSPQDSYGKMPLSFETNQGQSDPAVKYLAAGPGYNLWLTDQGATLELTNKNDDSQGTADVLQMRLPGADLRASAAGEGQLAGKANYFPGSDPSKWRTDVPLYSRIRYRSIYDGIDLVYYGNQQQLEYDFQVAPHADPQNIRIGFGGAEKLSIDSVTGELVLHAAGGDVRWHKPVSYQETDHGRTEVASSYVLNRSGEVTFELGKYDSNKPLTIDPTLSYLTYFANDPGRVNPVSIKVDAAGSAYIFGSVSGPSFPTTPGAYSSSVTCSQGQSACDRFFITKFDPTGSALVYSTYIGEGMTYGSSAMGDLAIDAQGNAYITGTVGNVFPNTIPASFPTTPGAYQPVARRGTEAFATKLNAAGNDLVFSTYLGGSYNDGGYSIAVDPANNVYVAGLTSNAMPLENYNEPGFPVTAGAWWTTNDGSFGNNFLTKFNPTGSALIYSTLFPRPAQRPNAVAVDSSGNAYVALTVSSDQTYQFPTTPNAFGTSSPQPSDPNTTPYLDCVLAKLDPSGSTMLYASYLGGGLTDYSSDITVDDSGKAYLLGGTVSQNFPTTANAFRRTSTADSSTNNGSDIIVSVFDTTLSGTASLIYSTYFGGTRTEGEASDENTGDIAVDSAGNIWITGTTTSMDLPTTPDAFQASVRRRLLPQSVSGQV